MKKMKYVLLTLLLCTVCAVGVTACKKKPTVLAAPTNLAVSDDGILTWDKVEGALSYGVDIDDKYYETKTNSLDIFELTAEYKTFEISVTAYGNLKNVYDSECSKTLKYTLEDCGTGELLTNGVGLKLSSDKTAYNVVGHTDRAKGKIVIPFEYNGKPIVKISYKAFYECDTITSIILPDSIETIDERAFYGCSNLQRVQIPFNIGTVGTRAFSGCKKLARITPPSVASQAFTRTSGSSMGYFPDSLTELGDGAFGSCAALTEIRLPDSLKKMGIAVFSYTSITEIELPQSLTNISAGNSIGCNELKSITMVENDIYKTENNCLIRKSDNALIAGCKTSVIPDYVKVIEASAFRGLRELQKIEIPESVETIKSAAFTESGLTEISLSANIDTVGQGAFSGCKKLEKITVAEGNPVYRSEGNCLIHKEDNALSLGCKTSVIPNGVEKIDMYAFEGSGIKKIELPKSIQTIKGGAFQECSDLTEIVLSNGLKKIGDFAFYKCGQLKYIAIPVSVEEIGYNAFTSCDDLTVVLPDTVQKIGSGALSDVTVYTSAESSREGWSQLGKYLGNYIFSAYYGCTFGYEDGIPYVV